MKSKKLRWVNIYEEFRKVIFDSIKVKHIYKKVDNVCFYICQYSLNSEINSLGTDLARKFYLVKTYKPGVKKPKRFDIKNGDIVRCYYSRNNKHHYFSLEKIVLRGTKEVIYPHPCFNDKPYSLPALTLYEIR